MTVIIPTALQPRLALFPAARLPGRRLVKARLVLHPEVGRGPIRLHPVPKNTCRAIRRRQVPSVGEQAS